MSATTTVRIFISSPADVRPERLLAERIVARLAREFAPHFALEAILWEREPLVATRHFQDSENIPEPRAADVVVVILWSTLGRPLPHDRFRGAISARVVTGTEWEFEDALQAARDTGKPDLLFYKKTESVTISLDDDAALERRREQKRLVDDFVVRWFSSPADGSASAAYSEFATTQEFEERLYDHLRKLLQRRAGSGDESLVARWHRDPFRGLLSFEYEHAPLFFGRTRARNEVREVLALRAAEGTAFVLVLGASGSGKSSLVKAGILPDLMLPGMVGDVVLCRYAVLRPSDDPDPVSALAAAIASDTALSELKNLRFTPDTIAAALRSGPLATQLALGPGLARALHAAGLPETAQARLIVVVDQLEEIFTASSSGAIAAAAFVSALDALARSGRAWVIATMRSDFFDRLEALPQLAELAGAPARYLLLPPTAFEIGQMIREPAREAGLRFEVDAETGTPLDERIRQVAANREALPLLSFVLDQLWRRDNEHGLLTVKAYEELGGLEGALAYRAEQEYELLGLAAQTALPSVLRALVVIGEDGQIAAKAAPLALFADGSPERQLIEAFASPDARLFIRDAGGAEMQPRVRVAHEALLTHWRRAANYIEENRADLQVEASLTEAAARWRRGAKDRSLLLPAGLPLEEALDLLRRDADSPRPEVREFVEASESAVESGAKLRRALAISLILVLALSTIASLLALYFVQRSRNDALIAQAQFLGRDAQAAVDGGNAVLGMLLALEALPARLDRPTRPFVPQAASALQSALAQRRELVVLSGNADEVTSAAFSPDGLQIVTACADGTARVSRTRDGTLLETLERPRKDDLLSAAFSPDGKRIITGGFAGSATIWNAATGLPTLVLPGHSPLFSVAFSRDGRRIVTASIDGAAIWDARRGALLVPLEPGKPVASAAFSPDGMRVATASADRTVRVWDSRSGAPILVISGHTGEINSVAYSADGRVILTASDDKTARTWNAATGAQLLSFAHPDRLNSAGFSPDGRYIVTSSPDNNARVWDARTGDLLLILGGHEESVTDASFSSDGRRIATASDDRTARIWNAVLPAPVAVFRDTYGSVAISPDGERVAASASGTASIRLWDAKSLAALGVLGNAPHDVDGLAFSPDGGRLAAAFGDKVARVYDVAGRRTLVQLRGHKGLVASIAFSPEGSRILTASWDGTARIWDANKGGVLMLLSTPNVQLYDARFSPDASRVVTASSDGLVRVWNAKTGRTTLALEAGYQNVNSAAFSPDGARIVTASDDDTARVWDANDGEPLLMLRGHSAPVNSAAYSPDGARIVTASNDKTARVWDAQTGATLMVFRGHTGAVTQATFFPDGRRVLTGSLDGTTRIWNAETPIFHCQALIDRARATLPRSLSTAEQTREFLDNRPGPALPLYLRGAACR
ncbi:MAG TPA: hypothetical protein VGX91_00150 [Candidatus Cybelea sp.]|jgi:WD40 repeat protein|nr:hypothetical protein [Candidatus Cybelea sp.]